MMRIDVMESPMKATPAVVRFVSERLSAALHRFGSRVAHVRVKIDDDNGPRGGVDKHCTIHAKLVRGGLIIAEDRDRDGYAAIDRAVGTLKRAMAKRVERRKRR